MHEYAKVPFSGFELPTLCMSVRHSTSVPQPQYVISGSKCRSLSLAIITGSSPQALSHVDAITHVAIVIVTLSCGLSL